MNAQRRDANEAEIVKALRAVGCVYIYMDKSAGFDALVFSPRNGAHVYEIKDPARRWKLTDTEVARKAEIEGAGGAYNVVLTIEQALQIAGYVEYRVG